MNNYEKLHVFHKAHSLVLKIYKATETFPKEEKFRLVDQMIRASYSIPSNIVEGNSKRTTRDYLNFLFIARGSVHELKYFLLLSRDLSYLGEKEFRALSEECDAVAKMLNGLINALKSKENKNV